MVPIVVRSTASRTKDFLKLVLWTGSKTSDPVIGRASSTEGKKLRPFTGPFTTRGYTRTYDYRASVVSQGGCVNRVKRGPCLLVDYGRIRFRIWVPAEQEPYRPGPSIKRGCRNFSTHGATRSMRSKSPALRKKSSKRFMAIKTARCRPETNGLFFIEILKP